jgi:hypothetical protein
VILVPSISNALVTYCLRCKAVNAVTFQKSSMAFTGYFLLVPQVLSDLYKLREVLTG